ncbi:MAG: deoxyguanosinetriphosphate triphosphohydrolase, partial [Pseudomonadota bacterium]
HDLHDGYRAGLFDEADIRALPMVGPCYDRVETLYGELDEYRRRHEALRRVFGLMVADVVETSRARLAEVKPQTVDDVRHSGQPLICFSDEVARDIKVIRDFLFHRMYRAPKVVEMRHKVTQIIKDLFPMLLEQPAHLPARWQADVDAAVSQTDLARLVADYIAGMTDRFALQMHERLICGTADQNTAARN